MLIVCDNTPNCVNYGTKSVNMTNILQFFYYLCNVF